MEEYEKFCKKHLARIQGEFMENGMSPVAQHKNVSLIQFNGVPVLSPLLTLEKKKELQQDRQKALDLECWRQNSKQRILLTRVEEIVANVQMKKISSQSDLDQSEKENIHLDLESKASNGFATESCNVLPNSPAFSECLEPKQTPDVKPIDMQGTSDGDTFEGTEQFIPHNPMETCSSRLEKRIGPEGTFSSLPSTFPSNEMGKKDSTDPVLAEVEGPDPYIMSLQNLLKKSKEYIQREQIRRSLRSSSKRNSNESHPDKENSAVKMNELGKERGKCMGRSTPVLTPEKSNLIKPNSSPQSSLVSKSNAGGITSSSFSKVDIPMRSGTPPVLDSDLDEDFRSVSLFERDSIFQSLTGSYSKLPSPEPSMSPKMHRRRPRPSSVGHIVITNPVNAYELSPKGKGGAADWIAQDASKRQAVSDPVPTLSADLVPICPRKAQAFGKSSSETFNKRVVGKCHDVCPLPANQQESRNFPVHPMIEGELMLENGSGCLSDLSPQELQDVSCPLLTQNPAKTESLPDKVKCSMPTELNKSYDVERPSPLLMQMQSKPLLDTPEMTLGNERILENGLEKVRRRLELEGDAVQKENMPWAVSTEAAAPERQQLHDQRYPAGAVLDAKNETPARCLREEALRQKMRALAELRQKLEEQHAQQLSLLIAEQEREQERLQKEIEEQARRLKEEKNTAAESGIPQVDIGVALEWRKISDAHLLESVLTRVEAVHSTNFESAGLVNAAAPGLPAGSPFYLWEQPASGKPASVSRCISRSKMRWSQVYSPEMKRKLNKISALAKGFLTRRLLQTEKLKHLRQTVHDTMEFIKNFRSEALLKRGNVPAQDANLQERVVAQLQAALYDIHDIFFRMEASERMNLLRQDREIRKEKMLRQLDKAKSPRERVTLSTATQKSLDRKKYIRAAEMGIPNKKTIGKQKIFENRVLQPNQGQNAPIQRLLSRQGTPKTSVKGAEQNRKKPSDNRVPNKAFSGVYAGRIQRKKPNVATT
ncbi:centriolar coiled-coil protein of 110 kDa isoform X2 [Candoia aspera]|uniref:centriolar coiled-coil protein of 110 kDa isoform X2 n=1 Tax=Candoia aspera TaxID=51853 RepID=UPI002FD7A5A3